MKSASPMRPPTNLRPLLAALLLIAAGCATPSPPQLMTDTGAQTATMFSDEVSRDLIRQTQQLLTLQSRDYLVGPDDVLEISIFEWEFSEATRTLDFRVAESGTIALPVLGLVQAADRSVADIQAFIVGELSARNILQNPRVAVSVKEFRSRRIGVVGAVNAPGVYAIHRNVTTLMDVLTLAAGPADGAGEVAYVLRKPTPTSEPVRIAVDLTALFVGGELKLNPVLQADDVVYVPKAPLFYVYGNVRQAGGFALQRPTQVLDAVALAGGLARLADKRNCRLMRRAPDGTQAVIPLSISDIEAGRMPNLYLRGGDVLNVPQSPHLATLSEVWNVFRGIFTFTYRLDSND